MNRDVSIGRRFVNWVYTGRLQRKGFVCYREFVKRFNFLKNRNLYSSRHAQTGLVQNLLRYDGFYCGEISGRSFTLPAQKTETTA